MQKLILGSAIAVAIAAAGCNKKMMPDNASVIKTDTGWVMTPLMLKNGTDSFSYAAGVNIAQSMKEQGIAEINAEAMTMAINAVLKNDSLLLNSQQAGVTLQQKLKEYAEAKQAKAAAASKAFFDANRAKPGVIELPNGLQYEVLQAAAAGAAKPLLSDTAVVYYNGTFIDGSQFDGNVGSGNPAVFPLTGVIKGWTEILQLMGKGSKWRVLIPSALAYGEQGYAGRIPGNTPLLFEIELVDIKHTPTK